MELINGKKLRDEILEKVKERVATLPFQPIFCDILVGEDSVSKQYVDMKARNAEKVGIHFHNASFPSNITTEELVEEIKKINEIPNMCGVIIQLPLPKTIDKRAVLDAIDPDIDVDCLGTISSDKFYKNENKIGFPTALACISLLDSLHLDLKNKNILVVGQGELVGRPVSALLGFRGIEPMVIVKETEDKETPIKNADIIISGTGHGKNIRGDMIKHGAVIIDAGTSESNAGIVGDVDLESVKDVASFVSPVPGGVGPVTVAMLLANVLEVAKNRKA